MSYETADGFCIRKFSTTTTTIKIVTPAAQTTKEATVSAEPTTTEKSLNIKILLTNSKSKSKSQLETQAEAETATANGRAPILKRSLSRPDQTRPANCN